MPNTGAGGGGGEGGGFASDAINAIMKHMGDPDGSNPKCIWIFAGYKKGTYFCIIFAHCLPLQNRNG